jgi:hypothetical protein
MLLVVTFAIGLVLWVVLWAVGAKALDAMLLSLVLLLTAAVAHIVLPMLPGNRRRDED